MQWLPRAVLKASLTRGNNAEIKRIKPRRQNSNLELTLVVRKLS